MDQATLVRSDVETGGLVLEALSRAKIPVSLFEWNYAPQLDEWQLIVATPWYDSKGLYEANSRVLKALQDAGIYSIVPIRRLSVRSPNDPLVKSLGQEIKVQNEGVIHILRHNGSSPIGQFAVIFSPFAGPGGAVPAKRLSGTDELRDFLDRRLHIFPSLIDEALADLARKGNASIPNVRLTIRDAKRLGLM